MEQYTKVKACFDENECKLITTFEEFEELRKGVCKQYYQYVRVRFTGSCSHESSVVFTNFYLRKTGKKCKDCVKKNSIKLIKQASQSNIIESDGIAIIEEYLSHLYEIIRTKEGCLADLAIRKKTELSNQWIPVQVKATLQLSHGMYSFTLNHNDYTNMLVICVCISEKKIWILPYNHLDIKYKINISVASKYNKYLAKSPTIIDTYLSEIIYKDIDSILVPITALQQREQEYVKKREQAIPFLQYDYPAIQSTCVDVLVNGKRVQEKVLGYTVSKNALHCGFTVNNGLIDKKRTYRCYKLGENDYYWLHSSIDDRFWIIPEQILHEKGYISNKDESKPKRVLWFKAEDNKKKNWLDVYQYNYTTIEKDIIMKVFG
jgi:hypothetical protein